MTPEQRRIVSERLAELADRPEHDSDWPADSLRIASDAGWRAWCVPREFGGDPPTALELLERYETLGAGDLSVALIVTQHDAAVDLIAHGDNEDLKRRLLPLFACGRNQTTVGIAQLTTSRQGGEPALRARRDGDAFLLDGLMPWVTAPHRCSHIVTGGVLADGSQLLACVPTDAEGLRIDPPLRMLGLNSSWTASVHCRSVRVGPDAVVRGPLPRALGRRSPVKPLVVSAVGIGLAGALVELLRKRVDGPEAEFEPDVRRLEARWRGVRQELVEAAQDADGVDEARKTTLRVAVNDLLVRLAVTAMVLCKGSGFVRGQRAERLVREAMFMQVWSAPVEVRKGTLALLAR